MRTHFEYRGVVVIRQTRPGALRWAARSKAGDPLAADTITSMKRLIKGR